MRLRVISDGTPKGTHVFDSENLEVEIEGVIRVEHKLDATSAICVLHLRDVKTDVMADSNPPTCPNCGGEEWHHTIDCFLGRDPYSISVINNVGQILCQVTDVFLNKDELKQMMFNASVAGGFYVTGAEGSLFISEGMSKECLILFSKGDDFHAG